MIELSKEQIPYSIDIPDKGKLLLAFSGGSDSLFLMAILSMLAHDRVEALYINHGIRGEEELDKEISLNRKNAAKLGIKLSIVALERNEVFEYANKKKCGIEAAARDLRYKALRNFASLNGFDYIITAHHREDQVETVIMRIMQNSPFYAYQGIAYQEGNIIRPLLNVPKHFISEFVNSNNLEYSEDSTNSDTKYKRNDIRMNIMPYISEAERACLAKIARNVYLYRKNNKDIDLKLSRYVSIDIDEFLSSSDMQRERAIFKSAHYLGNTERLTRKFLQSLYSIAENRHGRLGTAHLEFIASKDSLRIFKVEGDFSSVYSDSLNKIGAFDISHDIKDAKTLLVDISLLVGDVVIRKSKDSDKIKLKEGTKKVKELEKRSYSPYSIVIEDDNGIVCVFLREFGGSDRLASRFLTEQGIPISIS